MSGGFFAGFLVAISSMCTAYIYIFVHINIYIYIRNIYTYMVTKYVDILTDMMI